MKGTDAGPNCSDVLKVETRQLHAETESLLIQRIRNISSVFDYILLLHLFYGYFAPLEHHVLNFLSEAQLPGLSDRRSAQAILLDVEALGGQAPLSTASQLPQVKNEYAALGSLYVMEGSLLGGPHIVAMIRKRLDLPDFAFTFFTGYGAANRDMWQQFSAQLNAMVQTKEQVCMTVAAANETFLQMKKWIVNFR